jgi:hypothetical protein
MREHFVSDAPALFASVNAPPRGLSFGEWWQILVAARHDARLLTPECSLDRLLCPGIHPTKARVIRTYYHSAYQAAATARYGVVTAHEAMDLPRSRCCQRQQDEGDGEQPPDYAAGA